MVVDDDVINNIHITS